MADPQSLIGLKELIAIPAIGLMFYGMKWFSGVVKDMNAAAALERKEAAAEREKERQEVSTERKATAERHKSTLDSVVDRNAESTNQLAGALKENTSQLGAMAVSLADATNEMKVGRSNGVTAK